MTHNPNHGLERYTPGHSERAVAFMARRRLDPDGAFFWPHLRPGRSLLDCGCGPGTITCDIAEAVAPGRVVGLDASESALQIARANADERALGNLSFERGDVYALPFADAQFDAVFCNALLEHLKEPQRAVEEFFRVLRPGGVCGVRTPDWGGFLVAPFSADVAAALGAYIRLQRRNGGDPLVGRRLADLLEDGGFVQVAQQAQYENYPSLATIAEFLALNLDEADDALNAAAWRTFARRSRGMFAQAWVWSTGIKPPAAQG